MKQITILLLAICITFSLQAQHVHGNSQSHNRVSSDIFEGAFYSPEVVMHFSEDIKLTDAQEAYIKEEYKKAEAIFTDVNWDLKKAINKLHDLIVAKKIDETKVVAQMDKVLELEKRIKKQRVILMLRVKNKLTDDQKAKLDKLRHHHSGMKGTVVAPSSPEPVVVPNGSNQTVSPAYPVHPPKAGND